MTGLGHKLNYVLNTFVKRTPGQLLNCQLIPYQRVIAGDECEKIVPRRLVVDFKQLYIPGLTIQFHKYEHCSLDGSTVVNFTARIKMLVITN